MRSSFEILNRLSRFRFESHLTLLRLIVHPRVKQNVEHNLPVGTRHITSFHCFRRLDRLCVQLMREDNLDN